MAEEAGGEDRGRAAGAVAGLCGAAVAARAPWPPRPAAPAAGTPLGTGAVPRLKQNTPKIVPILCLDY
eukprot:7558491-Pyramimonas_sp.AAC.1